jgi:hypothetical protein
MSAAKAQLKRLADRLSDEDAGLLLQIGRTIARRHKAQPPLEEVTPAEAAELRARLSDPNDPAIPFEQACRELGI